MPRHHRQRQTFHPEISGVLEIAATHSLGSRVHRIERHSVVASPAPGSRCEMRNVPWQSIGNDSDVRSDQRHHHVRLPELPSDQSRENSLHYLPQPISRAVVFLPHSKKRVRANEILPIFHDCQLVAPVDPSKIVCVGRNYAAHAAEMGNEVPMEQTLKATDLAVLSFPNGGPNWKLDGN